MKITKQKLQKIIKEEIQNILNESGIHDKLDLIIQKAEEAKTNKSFGFSKKVTLKYFNDIRDLASLGEQHEDDQLSDESTQSAH